MDQNNIHAHLRNINQCQNDLEDVHVVSCVNLLLNKLKSEKDDELGSSIDTVLNNDSGIWILLKSIKSNQNKSQKPLLEKLYELFEFIIKHKTVLNGSHTRSFFDYCKHIIPSSCCTFELKEFAYKIFFLIAQHGNYQFFVEKSEDLLSFLKKTYWRLDSIQKSTEKQRIYQLIGTVVENFALVFNTDEKFLEKVSRNISSELYHILEKHDGSKITEVEGMLECLYALLKNYPRYTRRYHGKFYKHIKNVINRESGKHVALRGAIKIIEGHFDKFSRYIKEDYEYWYITLNGFLNLGKDDSISAKNALNQFYPQIAELLTEDSDENRKILKFFLEALRNDMLKNVKHNTELAVKNFIYFAEPCKQQKQKDLLNEMFNLTVCLLETYCSSFNTLNEEELMILSNMLHSTSGFLKHLNVEEFREEYFKTLEKATIMSISSFTKVPTNFQFLMKTPIIRTIINIAATNESYLDVYLENIINSGIIISCGHMTEGNLDTLRSSCIIDDDSLFTELLTYKDYLPLWKDLLNIKATLLQSGDLQLINKINLEEKICDKFVTCTLNIIEKLDISMKPIDELDIQEKPLMIEYEVAPCAEGDFNIFVNLVEMFSSLFSKRKLEFRKWIPVLVTKFIDLMNQNEIKFGFYKMLNVVFKQIKDDDDIDDIKEIKTFVLEELSHLNELQKTDSKACLQMIMNLPMRIVIEILPDVAPALQAAFERGSEDLLLAEEALITLEKWYIKSPKESFKPVLSEVIPYLKPFIQSKRFVGETDAVTKYEKKLMMEVITNQRTKTNQKLRSAFIQSGDSELDKLQKKVVKFLGKVDTDVWMPVFTSQNYIEWEPIDILKFDFPFKELKVNVFLDKFLPRIIELACNSSDLKTRIAACEVLHSCVIVFIGNSNHFENSYPSDAPNLFKRIILVVFKLGADVNDTIQQLFRPLSIQLAHYYSNKIQKQGVITNAFLEILFEAITTKNDASLRKFIAELIGEFVKWSLKQRTDSSTFDEGNVKSVIKQICLFCVQPCSNKKLGAALAFNSIYRDIRKYTMIRKIYWMELFLYFIQNMSSSEKHDCNNVEAAIALDNLTKTICENFSEFNVKNPHWRLPSWFRSRDKSLFHVQIWLLRQCFSHNEYCRSKCMEVLTKLLDGKNSRPNLRNFLSDEVLREYSNSVKKLSKPNVHSDDIVNDVLNWLQSLSAYLHCLYWLNSKGDVSVTYIANKEHGLFEHVTYFFECPSGDLKAFLKNPSMVVPASQEKRFALLKEEFIYRILEIVAYSEKLTDLFIGEQEWMKNFRNIFIKCIFDLYEVFPYTRTKIALPPLLKTTLTHLKNHPLRNTILKEIQNHPFWDTFSKIIEDPTRSRMYRKMRTSQALFILFDADVLYEILEEFNTKQIVRRIFHQLVPRDHDRGKAIVPDMTIVSYFENYLTFALKIAFKEHFSEFKGYIFDGTELTWNSTRTTHGMLFFEVFRKPILEYLVDHGEAFVCACVIDLDDNKMRILVAYLKYAKSRNKTCSAVFKYWNDLKRFAGVNSEKISELMSIIELASEAMNSYESSSVFDWLIECLRNTETQVLVKQQILELLPSFLGINFSPHDDHKFKEALRELEQNEINTKPVTEAIVVYNKLSTLLWKTANKSVFEMIIRIAILKENPFTENIPNTLCNLINGCESTESQLEALKVPLNVFKNQDLDSKQRLGAVQLFLVPMLNLVSENCVETFYSQEINFILNTAEEKIEANKAQEAKFLVKQIGAIILLEAYYEVMPNIDSDVIKKSVFAENYETESLHRKTSKIARNLALQNPKLAYQEANENLLVNLRGHSFNTLVKILRKTRIEKNDKIDDYLNFVFNNSVIWKHIIKLKPKINLTMSVEQTRTRRKEIVQKRRKMKQHNPNSLSIATEYATISSLKPELSKYDANHFTVSTGTANVVVEETDLFCEEREQDQLNCHECMNVLCDLMRYLDDNDRLVKRDENEEIILPKWMSCILKALDDFRNNLSEYHNIVLFILKFVTNCEHAIRPFAKHWFPVLINCLRDLREMNYVVTDVILMLLQWRSEALPQDREAISDLFSTFVEKINRNSKPTRSYQMQMLKAMIQVWHDYFDVPYEKILELVSSSDFVECEIGLEISTYFLLNNVYPYNEGTRDQLWRIFLKKISDPAYDKKTSTILGLILRVGSDKNNGILDSAHQQFKTYVWEQMMKCTDKNTKVKTQDIFSLKQHLVSNYPPFMSEHASFFLLKFKLFQGDYKKSCLQLLAKHASSLPSEAFQTLIDNGFEFCLKTDDHNLTEYSLKLIKELLSQIRIDVLRRLMVDIYRISGHESSQCRSAVYDLVDVIYKTYRHQPDEEVKDVKNLCKDILLAGLLDNDADLQNKSYQSWKDRCNLDESISQRFLSIVNEMYSPLHEAHFISYAVEFLLEACSLTNDFDELLFNNPLLHCTFQDYQIISSWRKKHTSLAPQFINSLPYRIATLGSQQVGTGTLSLQVYRTQNTVSGCTINLEPSTSTPRSAYSGGSFHPFKYIPPSSAKRDVTSEPVKKESIDWDLDRLKRRVIADQEEASKLHAIRNSKINEKKKEILAERADKRDKNVDLKRHYRKGDVPDIQIKKSELIVPLKVLAKRDPIIAKQIFTNIFLGMVNKLKEKNNYLSSVNQSFNDILRNTQQRGSVCLEALFEIAYSLPKELNLNLQSLAIASNMNNLLSLRALLLENSLIFEAENDTGPSPPKKIRTENAENDSLWIQLAKVYKSLDKYDVVNGIFKEKIQNNTCIPLKNGLQFETIGDWESALDVYQTEVEKMPNNFACNSEDQWFILDAYYKCSAYLSKWEDMSHKIRDNFDNLNKIVENDWHKEYTLPWLYLSEACKVASFAHEDEEIKKQASELIERDDILTADSLAEPLSVLMFVYKNDAAQRIVNRALDYILKEFNFSDSSLQKFLKLQTLSEIGNMISVVDNNKCVKEIDRIRCIWERSEPSENNLTWWDRRLKYRLFFASHYVEKLTDNMDDHSIDLCKVLKDYQLHSKLEFCEKALNQKNYLLACEYIVAADKQKSEQSPDEWKFKFDVNLCRMHTFMAEKKNCFNFAQLAVDDILTAKSRLKVCNYQLSMAESHLLSVIRKNGGNWPEEKVTPLILKLSELPIQAINVRDTVNELIVTKYQKASDTAEREHFPDSQISRAHLALVKHCKEILNEGSFEDELRIEQQIVYSTLRAMKYNSQEAYQLFPMLLQLNHAQDSNLKNTFITECEKVEEWKFLSWINQLLVYIGTDKVSLISDLVLRIAHKYPNAFQFAFPIAKESLSSGTTETLSLLERIENKLSDVHNVSKLIKALSFVHNPRKIWEKLEKKLEKSFNEYDDEAICKKLMNFKEDVAEFSGNFWKNCETFLDSSLDILRKSPPDVKSMVMQNLKNFNDCLEKNLAENKEEQTHLRYYSNWLMDFADKNITEIEMPGQYQGFSLPHPDRHVKIFGFHYTVKVMCSLKTPMKITITGDDARDYPYLVKCDEDTRQDQRIQQIFRIINEALASKYYCDGQQFSLNTFNVFPLNEKLGLIEWMENSVTLKDFRHFDLTEEEKKKKDKEYRGIQEDHFNGISHVCGGIRDRYARYNAAVKKFDNKSDILALFRKTCKKIPNDIFKETLLTLTTTPHSFWCLRNRFMTSYSAMSVCSWILGIGDRHLENIMVSLKTGTCVGIDFGFAFGTGTDFSLVPELIPFRMTPHIVSIMAPFYLTGLIRETMIQVLQTVRDNDYVLLATLPIFVLDPSVDWLQSARIAFQSNAEHELQDRDKYFEEKINDVKLKLEGYHPVNNKIAELRRNPRIGGFHDCYINTLLSSNGVEVDLNQNNLKTEEQVDCLLKLATDEFVLGTSWFGLETWM